MCIFPKAEFTRWKETAGSGAELSFSSGGSWKDS